MNQRIALIAEQAKKSVPHGLGVDKWIETYNDLFAELIIKECMAQCEKNAEHPYLGPGSKLSAFNIKEHFEVEL